MVWRCCDPDCRLGWSAGDRSIRHLRRTPRKLCPILLFHRVTADFPAISAVEAAVLAQAYIHVRLAKDTEARTLTFVLDHSTNCANISEHCECLSMEHPLVNLRQYTPPRFPPQGKDSPKTSNVPHRTLAMAKDKYKYQRQIETQRPPARRLTAHSAMHHLRVTAASVPCSPSR